jgi:Flp pilus assembly pilin Flp
MRNQLKTLVLLGVALQGTSLTRIEREEGQTLAEYALILALIALLVVGAIFFLRTQITSLFSSIGNNI